MIGAVFAAPILFLMQQHAYEASYLPPVVQCTLSVGLAISTITIPFTFFCLSFLVPLYEKDYPSDNRSETMPERVMIVMFVVSLGIGFAVTSIFP